MPIVDTPIVRATRSPGVSSMYRPRYLPALLLALATSCFTFSAAQEDGATSSEEEEESSAEMEGPSETVAIRSSTSDGEIAERLRQILTSAERIRGLEVKVRHGVVFLSGRTSKEEYKRWVTEVARKTQDVVAVINDLQVEDDPIHWREVVSHLVHLAIAYLLALPIAWDREREDRSAGLRTFPLVSVASCGYMLIALFVLEGGDAQARVMYGIITGIGFIGGGAILKDKTGVRGTATAASIWNTAAIGVAVAWKHFEIAIVLSALNFATLRFVADLKSRVSRPDETGRSGDEERR